MKKIILLMLVALLLSAFSTISYAEENDTEGGSFGVFVALLEGFDVDVQESYNDPIKNADNVVEFSVIEGSTIAYKFENDKLISVELNIINNTYAGEKLSYMALAFVAQFDLLMTENGLERLMNDTLDLIKDGELDSENAMYTYENHGAISFFEATLKSKNFSAARLWGSSF